MDAGDLKPIDVSSLREVESTVLSAANALRSEDWDVRLGGLRTLKALVIGSAKEFPEFPAVLRANATEAVITQVNDPRSQIVREVTSLIVVMASELGDSFAAMFDSLFPHLLSLTYVTIQVMNESSDLCIKSVFSNMMPTGATISLLVSTCLTTKHVTLRRRVVEYIGQLLRERSTQQLTKFRSELETLIISAVADASGAVRQGARLAYWAFHLHWADRGSELLAKLDSRTVQLVLKDKGKSWDEYIAEGQPKQSALKPLVAEAKKPAKVNPTTPNVAQKKKPMLMQHSSPTPDTTMPSPKEQVKGVQRAIAHSAMSKVTVVRSPPAKGAKRFAPEGDVAPVTPMQGRLVGAIPSSGLDSTKMERFAQFSLDYVDNDGSTTPMRTPKMTPQPVKTPTSAVSARPAAKTPSAPQLNALEQVEKALATESDKRREQFRSLNSYVALTLRFNFASETELERIFTVYRQNLNDQSVESIDEVLKGVSALMRNAPFNKLLPGWLGRLTPGLLKLFSVSKASKSAVDGTIEAMVALQSVSIVVSSAMDSFDAELSSPKVKMGGVRYLMALMSNDVVAQRLSSVDLKAVLQKVTSCNPWYKSQTERDDAVALFKICSTRFAKDFRGAFASLSFDKVATKSKQVQKSVAKLIGLADFEGTAPAAAVPATPSAAPVPQPVKEQEKSQQPNAVQSLFAQVKEQRAEEEVRQALSPVRTPSGKLKKNSNPSIGIKSPGKENAVNSPTRGFITIRNLKAPEPVKSIPKAFELGKNDFDLSAADIAALSAIGESSNWTSVDLLNSVDAALRLIATGDVAALESGKKALNEALDRASTITQSAAVKLLPKLAALTQHQSLLVSLLAKFDVSGAVDKFIVDFNEISTEKNGIATLTQLLLAVKKEELYVKLSKGRLLNVLLEGITHPNALTRREVVMAFAKLWIHLGTDFEPYLDQLNPREKKLVAVYKEKQMQPASVTADAFLTSNTSKSVIV